MQMRYADAIAVARDFGPGETAIHKDHDMSKLLGMDDYTVLVLPTENRSLLKITSIHEYRENWEHYV